MFAILLIYLCGSSPVVRFLFSFSHNRMGFRFRGCIGQLNKTPQHLAYTAKAFFNLSERAFIMASISKKQPVCGLPKYTIMQSIVCL